MKDKIIFNTGLCSDMNIVFHTEYKVLTIYDGYKIKDKNLMLAILTEINDTLKQNNIEFKRSIRSQLREWKVHNFLYNIGISTERTKDTDIDENESMLRRIMYFVIGIFL